MLFFNLWFDLLMYFSPCSNVLSTSAMCVSHTTHLPCLLVPGWRNVSVGKHDGNTAPWRTSHKVVHRTAAAVPGKIWGNCSMLQQLLKHYNPTAQQQITERQKNIFANPGLRNSPADSSFPISDNGLQSMRWWNHTSLTLFTSLLVLSLQTFENQESQCLLRVNWDPPLVVGMRLFWPSENKLSRELQPDLWLFLLCHEKFAFE